MFRDFLKWRAHGVSEGNSRTTKSTAVTPLTRPRSSPAELFKKFYSFANLLRCHVINKTYSTIITYFLKNSFKVMQYIHKANLITMTYLSWTHVLGNRVASRTPCHGSAGTGFLNRRLSTGGLANGTPLKTCTSRPWTITDRPRIGPLFVWTTSLSIIAETLTNRTARIMAITNCGCNVNTPRKDGIFYVFPNQ